MYKITASLVVLLLAGCTGGAKSATTAAEAPVATTATPAATEALTTAAPTATTSAPAATTTAAPTATTSAPAATTTTAPTATTSAPAPTTTTPRVPSIQIINLSSLATADIRSWTEVAAAKMSAWQADILGVVWPVGAMIREDARDKFDAAFNEMQIVLSDNVLSGLLDDVDAWIDATPCADVGGWRGEQARSIKENVRLWIGGGADAATAPDPCFESRMAIYAFTAEVTATTAQRVYIHELYHTLSSYLTTYCAPPDGQEEPEKYEAQGWIAEGTADYFSYVVQAEINGEAHPASALLQEANKEAQESGIDLRRSAAKSAAAVRLMIERGDLTEADVLGATMFNDCDWVGDFSMSNPAAAYAQTNWHLIEESGGTWRFTSAALNG